MQESKIIKEQKTSKAPFIISLLFLLILAGCYFLIPSFKEAITRGFNVLTSDDPERIRKWVAQFGMAGPLALILAMVVQMFLFVVPNILVMMIAILSYGPVWGSLISLLGVFCSSSLGYLIGKTLGPLTLKKFISKKTQLKISRFIEDYGVGAIAITRLSSLSNDSLSIVAGLLKMSYKKYILATLCGITPLIVLLALHGRDGRIERALIWIAAISMLLLVIYIITDKRRKMKRAERIRRK